MTLPLAIIFFALLMLYCGIKGRSLQRAILGRAEPGGTGQVVSSS